MTKKKTDGRRYKTEWTKAEDILIRRTHEENTSIKALAQKMGIHARTISSRMLALGLEPRTKKSARTWTPEMDAIVRKYIDRETREQIGKRVGMSKSSVVSRAKRLRIQPLATVAPEAWTQEHDDFLVANVKNMTQYEMASELKRSRHAVARRIKQLDLSQGTRAPPVTYIAPKAVKPSQVIPLTARPWLTRTSRECKYLYGQRHAYLACCEPVWGETGHCEAHAALCGGYKKVMAA